MAIEDSILKSTKKNLGLDENYDAFDQDVITHINTAFVVLGDLGVGPSAGFMIEGDDEVWDEFTEGNLRLNSVKSYVYLKVRLMFDPPGTSHHLAAMKEQVEELEHRLVTERNLVSWTSPSSLSLP